MVRGVAGIIKEIISTNPVQYEVYFEDTTYAHMHANEILRMKAPSLAMSAGNLPLGAQTLLDSGILDTIRYQNNAAPIKLSSKEFHGDFPTKPKCDCGALKTYNSLSLETHAAWCSLQNIIKIPKV